MAESATLELGPIFQAIGEALRQAQQALNQADPWNGNHGDHMVEIFQVAEQAACAHPELDLADALQDASRLLHQTQSANASAQVYAHGLEQMAGQLGRYNVSLPELVATIQNALRGEKGEGAIASRQPDLLRIGEVLKALMSGMAAWNQVESGRAPSENPLDMGVLFEFGMAYLQAKQRGGNRVEILADTAASISPLSSTPHRYESGKIAIQALLRAMQDQAASLPA